MKHHSLVCFTARFTASWASSSATERSVMSSWSVGCLITERPLQINWTLRCEVTERSVVWRRTRHVASLLRKSLAVRKIWNARENRKFWVERQFGEFRAILRGGWSLKLIIQVSLVSQAPLSGGKGQGAGSKRVTAQSSEKEGQKLP